MASSAHKGPIPASRHGAPALTNEQVQEEMKKNQQQQTGNSDDSASSASNSGKEPTREEVEEAQRKAASLCDLPHVDGAGCIKCNGIVSAILKGAATPGSLAIEFPTIPCPKNVELDPNTGRAKKCNACAQGLAQHPVAEGLSHGARGPNAAPDKERPCTCADKEQKAREFFGTEWAGRTAPDGTQVPELAVCTFEGAPQHQIKNATAMPQ